MPGKTQEQRKLSLVKQEDDYKPPGYRTGRPTKYRSEYCKLLFDHLAQGLSYETFGVTIGVESRTCANWEKKHKEFFHAKKKGFGASQLYWEKIGIRGMREKNFNAAVWIYNMKCRFRNSETFGKDDDSKDVNVIITSGPRSNTKEPPHERV